VQIISDALYKVYQHNNWDDLKKAKDLLRENKKKSRRKWIPLTREEILEIQYEAYGRQYKLCRFIEAKLKEKNQ
jgi:hypothetical protein